MYHSMPTTSSSLVIIINNRTATKEQQPYASTRQHTLLVVGYAITINIRIIANKGLKVFNRGYSIIIHDAFFLYWRAKVTIFQHNNL